MTPPACLRCKLARCAGRCVCRVDGRAVEEHGAADYCPDSPPRFGPGRMPLSWPSAGAGDTLRKVLDATGIGPAAKAAIEAATGRPCGCVERQAAANEAAPYEKAAT